MCYSTLTTNLHPMSDLSKEHFEETIKSLATKDDLKNLATKDGLKQQTEELKSYAREQTEELARMVNDGFEDVHRRLGVITHVRELQQTMDRKFAKLEEALHIKL
ncbi:MAG: hypothetical protein ACREDR_18930 [Blastocatellia bacterium]